MSNPRPSPRARTGTAARESGRRLILVGIDGSEAAANALEWSLGLAREIGGEVAVIHALDTELVAYLTQHLKGAFHLGEWEDEQRRAFEEEWTAPLATAGVPTQTLVVVGRPATVMLAAAERMRPELLVVGRHGHRAVTRMLLGTVADELVHHCTVPVIVFPRPDETLAPEVAEVLDLEFKE
jgi:nucleotide-binding universal stress UspA family protein